MNKHGLEHIERETRPPDFLAIGHVTHDRVDGRIRLGGAALYSAITAVRLGKHSGILTSYGEDFVGKEILDGIPTWVLQGKVTSTFQNVYQKKERIQRIYEIAQDLRPEIVPPAWRKAAIVYMCPVLHEVPGEMAHLFRTSIVGVAPQGMFRTWDHEGQIHARRWEGYEEFLRHTNMVIVSEKDIAGNEDIVDHFRKLVGIVIVTRAERGALVFSGSTILDLGVYPAKEREPTGAGDCFGASFLIRYAETKDIEEAARFASCVGSFVVEREGIEGIPEREDVLTRMKSYSIPFAVREQEH
jgi:1D-myo-inositol 3-kinase